MVLHDHEPGSILDSYITIGTTIFGYRTVAFDPIVNQACSYSHDRIGNECPYCDSLSTCVVKYNHYSDWYGVNNFSAWYCKDCFMLWESIKIGDTA